mmetsp:Transcript_119702/g.211522  ORF Transcript_119702/g.211522 Transcript_119702/m.211522 type:complete len:386 (-) Transcript_119702:57-1214(-)
MDVASLSGRSATDEGAVGIKSWSRGRLAERENGARVCVGGVLGTSKIVGDAHPATLDHLHDLGETLLKRGSLPEAEEIFRRTLAGRETVHGKDHPLTLRTAQELAAVQKRRGLKPNDETLKLSEPERMNRSAATALQAQPPGTASSSGLRRSPKKKEEKTLRELGAILTASGKDTNIQRAEAMLRNSYNARKVLFGATHAKTMSALTDLDDLLEKQGRPKASEVHKGVMMKKKEEVLGPEELRELRDRVARLEDRTRQALDQEDYAGAACLRDEARELRFKEWLPPIGGRPDVSALSQQYLLLLEQIELSGWQSLEAKQGFKLLHWASKEGDIDLCRYLTRLGAPIEELQSMSMSMSASASRLPGADSTLKPNWATQSMHSLQGH